MNENPYQADFLTTKQEIEINAEEALIEMYWDDPVKFKKRLKKLKNKIMSQEVFWIPTDVEEHRQMPLSVPGKNRPMDSQEHRSRLLNHLLKLAQEIEDEGLGELWREVEGMVVDSQLTAEGRGLTAVDLVEILRVSDGVYFDSPEVFSKIAEDQQSCREMGLQERLAAIGTAP